MVKMEEKNMPRRGENIYKRKDGRWEARYIYSFKEDGSPRYRSIYAADYLTVKKKQNDAKRKMDPRLFQSVRMKKNISFYGLLWLERLKPSSKESTYVRYHYLFSHYIQKSLSLHQKQKAPSVIFRFQISCLRFCSNTSNLTR